MLLGYRQAILGSVKIEGLDSLEAGTYPLPSNKMNSVSRPSAFSNMNKQKYPRADDAAGYRAWKTKDTAPTQKKEPNISSFTEFPDLVKEQKKQTVFEGSSLASKLKEVIAAEEEAAILKRLKKGDTPEMILRESCTVLPLKGARSTSPLTAPWWITDTTVPVILPGFRPKSLAQQAEERKWKRLGIDPSKTRLFDDTQEEDFIDDAVSMPSMHDDMSETEDEPEVQPT